MAALSDRLSARIVGENIKESLRRLRAEVEGERLSDNETQVGMLTMAGNKLHTARTLATAGFIRPERPDRILRTLGLMRRWGPTPAAGFAASAIRFPHDTAIIDELGTITFEEVHRRSNALAYSLCGRAACWRATTVGVMCPQPPRLHRDDVAALSKLGAHALYLNTAFAGPAAHRGGEAREARGADLRRGVLRPARGCRPPAASASWPGTTSENGGRPHAADELIAAGAIHRDLVPPEKPGRTVILTSGTTGTPKGAARSQPETLDPAAALLSKIPLRHAGELADRGPAVPLVGVRALHPGDGCCRPRYVLQRKFDPEATLAGAAQHQVTLDPDGPGDGAAHHGAAGGDAAQVRALVA